MASLCVNPRDAGKGAAAAAAAAMAAKTAMEEGTHGTSRQRDFTGVWRAVSCDGLHSYLAAAGVVDGEGKRAIVHRMSLPVHELRMHDESRLTCTVVRSLRSLASFIQWGDALCALSVRHRATFGVGVAIRSAFH